ncbi:unnamed protein product [Linum trigynum]|uniref:Uncharacterized protein n=1 Tax=Linum trigynum TaxID=586398 RepID=A0AAV2GTI9_9ROSI
MFTIASERNARPRKAQSKLGSKPESRFRYKTTWRRRRRRGGATYGDTSQQQSSRRTAAPSKPTRTHRPQSSSSRILLRNKRLQVPGPENRRHNQNHEKQTHHRENRAEDRNLIRILVANPWRNPGGGAERNPCCDGWRSGAEEQAGRRRRGVLTREQSEGQREQLGRLGGEQERRAERREQEESARRKAEPEKWMNGGRAEQLWRGRRRRGEREREEELGRKARTEKEVFARERME